MAKGLCANCYHRLKYAENSEHYIAYKTKQNAARRGNITPEQKMLYRARDRATAKGLEFDLTISDIRIPLVCPILGIPLEVSHNTITSSNSPSLDRIDNSKGYIRGNIIVISWRANRLKGDGTLEEITKILDFYTRLQKRNSDG